MVDCCRSTQKHKKCIRKKDKKVFKLPRKFSKKKCRKPKGFTMRSSCAVYKGCFKGGNKRTYKKNINNKKLKLCSTKPMTGYYRNGYCMTGPDDTGTHTVCAKMDKGFLDYTASKGNDLRSVVKEGEKWCLCEFRWEESYKKGKAPKVIKAATNMRTKKNIQDKIRRHKKTKKGGKKKKKLSFKV